MSCGSTGLSTRTGPLSVSTQPTLHPRYSVSTSTLSLILSTVSLLRVSTSTHSFNCCSFIAHYALISACQNKLECLVGGRVINGGYKFALAALGRRIRIPLMKKFMKCIAQELADVCRCHSSYCQTSLSLLNVAVKILSGSSVCFTLGILFPAICPYPFGTYRVKSR